MIDLATKRKKSSRHAPDRDNPTRWIWYGVVTIAWRKSSEISRRVMVTSSVARPDVLAQMGVVDMTTMIIMKTDGGVSAMMVKKV